MANNDLFIEQDDEGNEFVRLSVEDAKAQRELARQAKANADAAERATIAERKLAFIEAGIDSKNPIAELFVDAYKGDLTAEAIKTAAAKYPGLLGVGEQQEQQQEEQKPTDEELAEQRLRQQLATGQAPGQGPKPDPRDEAVEIIEQARKQGVSEDKALALGFGRIRQAAYEGDERVIVDVFGRNTA